MFARFCVAFTLFQIINASYKNSKDLIKIVDLLNDDESRNPADNLFTPDQEGSDLLNSDQIEILKDAEKEKKLRQILQLLKRNNDAETLYKDLEKSPKTPQLFVIDNPEVLEDFKEYLFNKHSSKYRNDLNSYEKAVRRNINQNQPDKPKSKSVSKHKKRKHKGKGTDDSKSNIQKISEPNITISKIKLPKPSKEPFPVNKVHKNNVKASKESTKLKDTTYINLSSKPIKRKKPKAGTKNEKTTPDSETRPEREDNKNNGPSYVGIFLDGPSDRKKSKPAYSNEAVPNRDLQKHNTRDTHIASEKRPKPKHERPMPNYGKKLNLNIPRIQRGSDNDDESTNKEIQIPYSGFGSIKNKNRYDSDGPSRNRYNDNSRNRYSDNSRNRNSEYSRNRYNDNSRDRYNDNSRNRHVDYLRNRNSDRNVYSQGRTPIPIGRNRNIYERD